MGAKKASDWMLVNTAPGTFRALNFPPEAPLHWFPGVTYRTVYARHGVWLFQRVR